MASHTQLPCARTHRSQALFAGFVEANATCMSRYKESGATATLAVSVGWELLVASVGDSLAYLDTGSEIVQVRGGIPPPCLSGTRWPTWTPARRSCR